MIKGGNFQKKTQKKPRNIAKLSVTARNTAFTFASTNF